MKAARYYGPGDIRIDDMPEPRTRPGTIKVEVEWCGICGTDLHEYLEGPIFAPAADAPHPLTGETVPITLGHEFAGLVHEVGDGIDDVHVGDRVVVEPYIICGHCDACAQGKYNVCESLGFVGLSGFGGGFSQLVVAERRWIHPLGDLGTDLGALVEPLAVAHHAVRLSGAQPNHSALVFGAGPIGLVTTAALRAAGVEQIIVVEPAAVRKQKAPIAGGARTHQGTRRRRLVRVRRDRRRPKVGHTLDPSRRDVRERRDLGPRGIGGDERPRVPRGERPGKPRVRERPSRHDRDDRERKGRSVPVHHRTNRP